MDVPAVYIPCLYKSPEGRQVVRDGGLLYGFALHREKLDAISGQGRQVGLGLWVVGLSGCRVVGL